MASIKEKILVRGVLFFLFIALSGLLFSYVAVSRIRKNTISSHLQYQTEHLAGSIDALLDGEVKQLSCTFQNPRFLKEFDYVRHSRFLNEGNTKEKLAASLFCVGNHSDENEDVAIVDTNGQILVSTHEEVNHSVTAEEWWRQRKENAIYIGRIQFDSDRNVWYFPFIAPIYNTQKKQIGFYKKLFILNDMLGSTILRGERRLIDYDIVFIDNMERALPLPGQGSSNEQSFLGLLREHIKSTPLQPLLGNDLKGQKAIITYVPVNNRLLKENGQLWGISITQDISTAFAPVHDMFSRQVRFTIIIIFISVVFILVSSRKLVAPLLTLQTAMQKASTGNLNVRTNIKTGDEIEQLASTFNWMITDLKVSQHEITERKIFFENIVNNMSDTLVVLYNDGTIRAVNKQLLLLLGYTEEELIHKSVEILFQEGESFEIIRHLLETIKKNPKQTVKVKYRTKGLEPIPIHLSCNLVRDKHNEVDGLVLVGTDLREQMRMIEELDNSRKQLSLYSKALEEKVTVRTAHLEKALNEAQEMKQVMLSILEDFDENRREMERIKGKLEEWNDMMQVLVASLNEGVLMLDERGEVTVFNPSAKFLLGFQPEEELDSQRVIEHLKDSGLDVEFVQSWQGQQTITKEIRLKNPEFRILHIDISPVLKNQTIVGLALGIHDITREKEIDRLKKDFISTVSHELRTPVTCIREAVAQISEGIKGPINEGQEEFLHIAIEELDRLSRIINDLLDISKIEAGRVVIRRKETDIVMLIHEVVKTLSVGAAEKNIAITEECSLPSCVLFIDPDRIKQVVTNVLSNALKFTMPDGIVHISVQDDSKEVVVAIQDTGRGIAPENLYKVFDRFEQVDWSYGIRPQGTGLGLAISKALIEMHRGSITVQSTLGKGSTFSMVFPKLDRDAIIFEIMKEAMQKARDEYGQLSFIFISLKDPKEGSAETLNKIAQITQLAVRRADDLVLHYKDYSIVVVVHSPKGGACALQARLMESIKEACINEDCIFDIATYPDEIHNEVDLQVWFRGKDSGGKSYGAV